MSEASGAATASVRVWLRLGGFAVLAFAVYLYARGDHSWLLFAALFLVPDAGFAAYAAGPFLLVVPASTAVGGVPLTYSPG